MARTSGNETEVSYVFVSRLAEASKQTTQLQQQVVGGSTLAFGELSDPPIFETTDCEVFRLARYAYTTSQGIALCILSSTRLASVTVVVSCIF